MPTELNDRLLKSLSPPETGRTELSDTKRRGLRFRLAPTGQGVWMYEKRIKGGLKRKHTLGGWPAVSLADARAIALELEAEAARGYDRIAENKTAKLKAEVAKSRLKTVGQVIDLYDELHLRPNLRTADERKRQLIQSFEGKLFQPIADVSRSDLQLVIDTKAREGRLIMANRLKAALCAFSKWAWQRGYIQEDIGAGVVKAASEQARERVLSVPELRHIWSETHALGDLWGPLVRLLILTAQRRGDIINLKWEEIDFGKRQISISGARTKNKKPHITHLSEAALVELEAMRKKTGNSEFVFTTTGTTAVSGVSKVKARLDGLLGEGFEAWRLHDIRTGFATAMAEAGEAENVVDRILNHVASGSAPSAVARVYNRAEQLPQRARVLNRWSNYLVDKEDSALQFSPHNH